MRSTLFAAAALLVLSTVPVLTGCRGMTSEKPPIHPVLNMDFQPRFEEQEANPFFADNAAMRPPVPGTVPRGGLRTTENAPFYYGRTATGAFVETIPMAVTPAVLERGQERYDIYCTVCHGAAGDGQGIIMVGNNGQGYGYTPVPSYHVDRLRAVEDGYLYNVIANGIRNMPSYAHQISVPDRWAIVAYIRALQTSQGASQADVPEPVRAQLQSANPNVPVN